MATYERHRYLLMTTDPVHIGTGGYRLGRVDNSIVREPGTKIPKIPGTSLHGAARAYSAAQYERRTCAGQGQGDEKRDGHCGKDDCPVCYTFGFLKKEKKKKPDDEEQTTAYSGVVNAFDAQVLLFPVHSMVGPVWVSTFDRLREAGFIILDNAGSKMDTPPVNWDAGAALTTWAQTDHFNLGWLMVSAGQQATVTAPDKWKDEERWKTVQARIVLVHDALFSQVVNSNLEVRTSVSIEPDTGAAKEGALFTYEALPRATFLTAEVVLDDYRDGAPNRPFPKTTTANNKPLPNGPWAGPLDVITAGLRMIEWLGVGGMGTRGFGRLALVGQPLSQPFGQEEWQ